AAELDRTQAKTLVFIQDGILRSIPMAALHDGTQFLIQKYAIATTPSLTLTDPKTLNHQRLRALVLGLTTNAIVDGQPFPALANVGSEIREVETQFPGSQQLLNNSFTSTRLQQALNQSTYSIIHIATHGKFGSEPQDTFLITGNNDKLTIDVLDTAIRNGAPGTEPVGLLVLTACETAVGDDRAALGLAGVAVQAGVSSVLASLWSIQDAPTVTLVAKFYSSLHNTGMSKAEALRVAQQALIEAGGQSAHPAYWAPFILIGNWL
ncbi:MAG: CHAT domain-containing protein, partial [Chroococcidiopsidaceae cyanobacterium CP_BM_ER_R8_30]|nr:CHAT domain-containing protein [Chroococcidiopsidaceae cyanobacterium CP_BM_ER_R8_30]